MKDHGSRKVSENFLTFDRFIIRSMPSEIDLTPRFVNDIVFFSFFKVWKFVWHKSEVNSRCFFLVGKCSFLWRNKKREKKEKNNRKLSREDRYTVFDT